MNMPLAPALARSSPWTRVSALVAIASVLVFMAAAWTWPWRPGRIGGLTFGMAAAALYVNAALYPWRRRWNARPLGTARRWLQLHVHGSALATLFVLLHAGWRWPAGTIGWLLFALSIWAGVTGLLGVWLQRAVPRLISRRLTVEAIYERIPELVRGLAAEADALMNGAPEALARAYASEIRPVLGAARPSLKWLTGTAPDVIAATGAIDRLRPFAGGAERQRLADLASILQDKADLDAQLSLQRLLRGWLLIHVPPAVLLIGVLVVHVAAVVWH
jgi:hypothetical protein